MIYSAVMRDWWLPVAFAVVQLLVRAPAEPVGIAVLVVATVALGFRRRAPVTVTAVIAVATSLPTGLATGLVGDELLVTGCTDLVALFTVAARRDRRTALLAAAGLTAGHAVAGALTDAPEAVGDTVFNAALYAVVVVLGRLRRRWQADRDAADRRLAEARAAERAAERAERDRLARELHDVTAHHLTSIVVNAQAAQALSASRPELAAEALAYASRAGRDTLDSLHRLVSALPDAEEPPDPAGLVDDFRLLGQLVTLEIAGTPEPEAALALHGILREALTNTVRYAPGATVHVRLTATELLVDDDGPAGLESAGPGVRDQVGAPGGVPGLGGGRGLPGVRDRAETLDGTAGPRDRAESSGGVAGLGGGRGLPGMRDRAEALGGTVTAGPHGDGWRVHARLPVAGAARSGWWLPGPAAFDLVVAAATAAVPALVIGVEGYPAGTAAVLWLATAARSVPLAARRRHPWAALAAVLGAGWIVLVLGLTGVFPLDGAGWIVAFGVGADLAAVYAVAAWSRRPALAPLAPAVVAVSGALVFATAFLFVAREQIRAQAGAKVGEQAGGHVGELGLGGAVVSFVLVAVLAAVLLGAAAAACWALARTVRSRRERRRHREEQAVAGMVALTGFRALGERARMADRVRSAVLHHAAQVPIAADRADLPAVVAHARLALAAMRTLLTEEARISEEAGITEESRITKEAGTSSPE